MLPLHLANRFPKLGGDGGKKTSDQTPTYNCISWSLDRSTDYRFEPKPIEKWEVWPKDVPDDYSLESFILLFEKKAYKKCSKTDLKFEIFSKKVVIYAAFGIYNEKRWEFTHVADELNSGAWTSKLGSDEDIQHNTPFSLEGENGDEYGEIYQVLKRNCSFREILTRTKFKIYRALKLF